MSYLRLAILGCAWATWMISCPFASGYLETSADAAETTTGHSSQSWPVASKPNPSRLVERVSDLDAEQCATPLGRTNVAILDSVPIVTLLANGRPLTLVLDTGAERTILTPEAAARVAAETPRIEFARPMHGLKDSVGTREVELRSFTASGLPIPSLRVLVGNVTPAKILPGTLDGLLGADTLAAFDLDVDFAKHWLAFYARQSCPPGWTAGHPAFSAGISRNAHFFLPVELDGHRLYAFLDTGAQRTLLTATAARTLGVTETALQEDLPIITQGATTGAVQSRVHRFSQLKIGNETINHPEIVVSDVQLRDSDMILGMDYLRSHRLWLSYAAIQVIIAPTPK